MPTFTVTKIKTNVKIIFHMIFLKLEWPSGLRQQQAALFGRSAWWIPRRVCNYLIRVLKWVHS